MTRKVRLCKVESGTSDAIVYGTPGGTVEKGVIKAIKLVLDRKEDGSKTREAVSVRHTYKTSDADRFKDVGEHTIGVSESNKRIQTSSKKKSHMDSG